MAHKRHVKALLKSIEGWNTSRGKFRFRKPNLSRADLRQADLHQANLRKADLTGANLNGADLSGANLTWADLTRADLSGADLSGTNLSWANLSGADLTIAKAREAHLIEVNLSQACLRRADLSGVDFSGADLNAAEFHRANLTECCFRGANLCLAKFDHARLDGAKLRGAKLRNASLREASLVGADLRDADIEGSDLCKADLTRAWLIGANFTNATLDEVNLTKAILVDAEGRSATVTGASLTNVRLTRQDESSHEGSFLDLAGAEGLDKAKFGDLGLLQQYLADALAFACRPDLKEKKELPEFVETVLQRIRALRKLYADHSEPPAHLVDVLRTISAELIKYIAKHPRELYKLRPRQFEELIAEILASYGWLVDLTPAIKDGGYDILAISKDDAAGVRTSWIIECKKYAAKRKVGVDVVRALFGVKADLKVANALLATTSYFTKGVKDYKASRYDLELKDYGDILDWINTYRPNPDGQLYIKDNQLILPE